MSTPFAETDGARIRALMRERNALEPGAHHRVALDDPGPVERIAAIDAELEALGVRRTQPPPESAPLLGPDL
jgi:hypothetical protein